MTLKEVRDEYEKQREQQRVELRKYLSAHEGLKAAGLEVLTRGGKGSINYRGNYDLRNWKWVTVKSADGFDCAVSLNMLDIDPDTKDIHSLYDRIGLVLSPDPKDWHHTDIDLPLDKGKMDKIADHVIKQYNEFKKKKGV